MSYLISILFSVVKRKKYKRKKYNMYKNEIIYIGNKINVINNII